MPVCTGLRGRGQVTGRSDGFSARPAARAGRRGWLFGSPGCGWCGGRKGARGCRWTELEEGAPGARCGGEGGLAAGEACGQGSCAPQPEPPWPWPPQRVGLPQDGGVEALSLEVQRPPQRPAGSSCPSGALDVGSPQARESPGVRSPDWEPADRGPRLPAAAAGGGRSGGFVSFVPGGAARREAEAGGSPSVSG